MITNDGESLFERYLHEQQYEILGREPSLGTAKRPDYLIRAHGRDLVAEVKSFNTQIRLVSTSGGFTKPLGLTEVRRMISVAADQSKGIEGCPLVAVLTNPKHLPLPLSPDQMVAAMYGDHEVVFTNEGELLWRSGRNGRLRVDEPNGSRRGNHPHLSALAVLRCESAEGAFIASWLQRREHEYPNRLAAYVAALKEAEDAGAHGEVVSLDVYETVSESAVPLPAIVFNGAMDTRWGKLGNGHYGRLSPPMLSR